MNELCWDMYMEKCPVVGFGMRCASTRQECFRLAVRGTLAYEKKTYYGCTRSRVRTATDSCMACLAIYPVHRYNDGKEETCASHDMLNHRDKNGAKHSPIYVQIRKQGVSTECVRNSCLDVF